MVRTRGSQVDLRKQMQPRGKGKLKARGPRSTPSHLRPAKSVSATTVGRQLLIQDSDETLPPSPEESSEFSGSSSTKVSTPDGTHHSAAPPKPRGKTKCVWVDANTHDGKKIKVDMKKNIGKAVGKNARKIVNFCGMTVRAEAKLRHKNWAEVEEKVGLRMVNKVLDKFEAADGDTQMLTHFIFATLRREWRTWKYRLHKYWSSLAEDQKRSYVPDAVDAADWNALTSYWKSDHFLEMSGRNKSNRAKQIGKHTCGSRSFAEVSELMIKADTGEEAPVDELWYIQHTKKDSEGNVIWSDPTAEETYHKLQQLISKQGDGVTGVLTGDEMLLQVLGHKSGYFRGKGAGVKAPGLARRNVVEIEQVRNEVRAEMQADFANMLADQRKIYEDLLSKEQQKFVEEKQKTEQLFQERIGEAVRAEIAAFLRPDSTPCSEIP